MEDIDFEEKKIQKCEIKFESPKNLLNASETVNDMNVLKDCNYDFHEMEEKYDK